MLIFCLMFACYLPFLSLSEGRIIAGTPGDNIDLQWTMDPVPDTSNLVTVLHPKLTIINNKGKKGHPTLFTALGTYVLKPETELSDRVTNTDNINTHSGHIEFTLNNITKEDAGEYTTTINVPGGIVIPKTGITLVFYAKPSTPKIIEEAPPVVGHTIVLTCSAMSNSSPKGNTLSMYYIWYINGISLFDENRYNISGSHLQVKNIQMEDKQTVVTCKGYENITMASDVSDGYNIVPKYGPDAVSLDTKNSYTLFENKDTLGPISCSAGCEPNCTYQWKFNDANITIQGSILTINNINRTDAGTYWCEASNEYGSESSVNVTVIVHYGPDEVTFTPNTTSYNPLENSDTLGPITCSAECYPECSYQWLHDGLSVSNTASLTIPGIPRSATGVYNCKAKNSNRYGTSESIDIDVEYKPGSIVFEPSNLKQVLFENEKLGPINCSADCNPPCQYRWLHNGRNTSQSSILHDEKVLRDDNGTYMCVAWNEHGDIWSKDIYLDVHYGPDDVSITPNNRSYVLDENMKDTLGPVTCLANCNPECTYTWMWNNITLDSQGGTLIIDDVKRDKAGIYTCIASNLGRLSKTTNIEVIVEYGPGVILLSPSDTSYILLEQNSTLPSINCSAECLPPCTFTWRLDGQKLDPIFKTQNQIAVRTMAGKYECYAENIHGISSVIIDIGVQYAPDIPKLTKSIQGVIMENKSISLVCTTDSVPLPDISIVSLEADGKSDSSKNSLNKTLTIQTAQCLDTGEYRCEAVNKIGCSSSDPVMLNVTCLPRPDHRVYVKKDIYIGNNGSIDIVASVIANPAPVLSWTFSVNGTDSITLKNNSNGFTYYQNAQRVTYTSHIVKSKVEAGDYGRYTLRAANTFGDTEVYFNVIAKRSPDPPYDGNVNCYSGTAATVTWKSNFNGGGQQHFLVKTLRFSKIGVPAIRNQRFEDNGIQKVQYATVENLSPSTRYSFIVEAHNSNGDSKMGVILNCTTKPLDDDETGTPVAVIGGAVGGSLAFIIIIVILGVALFMKRRKQTKDDDTQLMNMGAGNALHDEPDGVYENVTVNAEDENANAGETTNQVSTEAKCVSRRKNQDGLVYIDVEILDNGKGLKFNGIHGADKRVNYVEIDITKHADPLPSDDDDDVGDDKNNSVKIQ